MSLVARCRSRHNANAALVAFLVVAIGFGSLAVSDAFAQNPFAIDGTVPENGGLQLPPKFEDPFGSVQELGPLNSNSTKVGVIHTDAAPTLDFTNPNGQVDLRRVWLETRKALDGDQWLYFAWERDANSGSGFISIEFQKAALNPACVYTGTGIDLVKPASAAENALIANCNPWAGRSAGDFIILWDQSGSSLNMIKRVFTATGPGGSLVLQPAPAGGGLGSAVPAIGPTGFFGEVAINLTDDVFGGQNSCVNFANILPGTVTGNSDTADYKDTVLSAFPDISNCGTVVIKKATQPATATPPSGGFAYLLDRTGGGIIKFTPPNTTQIDDTLAEGAASTYTDTWVNLIAGSDYRLIEDAQVLPWQYDSMVCKLHPGESDELVVGVATTGGLNAIQVEAGETTECTITNKLKQQALKVIKIVVNDNGGTLEPKDFTMFVDLNPSQDQSFPGQGGAGTSITLTVGETFTVTESNPTGYAQVSTVGCTGTITEGQDSTCTITNDDLAPSLTLVKQVVNDNGGTSLASAWTLSATGTTDTPLSGTGTCSTVECIQASLSSPATFKTGTYGLGESGGPATYSAGSWSCVGGQQSGSTITLGLGDSATCTIINNDLAASTSVTTVMEWLLKDHVTLSGLNMSPLPDGKVRGKLVFNLYSGPNCSAAPIHTEEIDNVAENKTYTTPSGKLITQAYIVAGTNSRKFHWVVNYTGDQFNEPSNTQCGDESHTITIP
jgi:hypothetical protein